VLSRFRAAVLLCVLSVAALLAQRGFRGRYYEEYVPLPADAGERTEFVFGRLRYGSMGGNYYRRGGRWATDYPKADRQFLQGLRRLTRLHTRSVEQVVDIDSDQIFEYPWLYAVEVGSWGFTEEQAKRLRDYLNRGGLLLVDDFHGMYEWDAFAAGMKQVFPARPIVDLDDKDPIFHVLYDLDERFQVPGIHYLGSGVTHEKGGIDPRWRGVYDDEGRLMVAICYNMDLGDAWEWADHPQYPENFASLAYRIAINYIIYSMTR